LLNKKAKTMNRNYQNFLKSTSAKFFALAFALIFVASSCNQNDDYVTPEVEDLPSLTDALEAFDEEVEYVEFTNEGESNARWGSRRWKRKPTFFTLVSALNYTGLLKTVVREKLTIFAPDDKAFGELGLNLWNVRQLPKDALTDILLSHVVDGFVFSGDLPECSIETLNKSSIGIDMNEGITLRDDTGEPINLLFTDRRALRSVFHGIDKVLELQVPDATIAAIAQTNGNFEQLVLALARTSTEEGSTIDLLAAVLDEDADLTVFAPIDQAFSDLYKFLGDEGILPAPVDINDIPLDLLTQVLLHHVVGDRAFSACLGDQITTLNEDNIKINVSDLTLESSGGSTVGLVDVDIQAVNGVVHVIDGVLLPQNVLDALLP